MISNVKKNYSHFLYELEFDGFQLEFDSFSTKKLTE